MMINSKVLDWFLLLILAQQTAFAFVPPQKSQSGVASGLRGRVLRPKQVAGDKFYSFSSNQLLDSAVVTRDAKTGAVRILSGRLTDHVVIDRKNPEAYITFIKKFLTENLDILGVVPEELTLRKAALYLGDDVQFLSFAVNRNGTLIKDAGLEFRFKFGRLVQVANNSYSEAFPDKKPQQKNLRITAETMGLGEVVSPGQFYYRVQETLLGYQLIPVMSFTVNRGEESLILELNATNGKVFEFNSTRYFINGKVSANIFERWWGEELQTFGLPLLKLGGNEKVITNFLENFLPLQKPQSKSLPA